MDELSRRRRIRAERHDSLVVPPMDGSVEQVLEDLTIVTGMVTEVLAEVRACEVVPTDLHVAVVELDDAAGRAKHEAQKEVDRLP